MTDHVKKINILTIDGGGIRGIIPLVILVALEKLLHEAEREKGIYDEESPSYIVQKMHVMSGTSTGGIISLLLTMPDPEAPERPKYRPSDILLMYRTKGDRIFCTNLLHRAISWNGLFRPQYKHRSLEKIAKEYFGETELREALCDIVVPGFELGSFHPILFKRSTARSDPTLNYYMTDVARATSAAPTYFCPARICNLETKEPIFVIDGGLVANNPSMNALVEASREYPNCDYMILSLGTGHVRNSVNYKEMKNKGLLWWVPRLFGIMMGGTSTVVHEQLERMMEQEVGGVPIYYRFEPILDGNTSAMDHVSKRNIARLGYIGDDLVRTNQQTLRAIVSDLLDDEAHSEGSFVFTNESSESSL